jgi:hypothetical protein
VLRRTFRRRFRRRSPDSLEVARAAQKAPRPCTTAGIVLARIARSTNTDQRSR